MKKKKRVKSPEEKSLDRALKYMLHPKKNSHKPPVDYVVRAAEIKFK